MNENLKKLLITIYNCGYHAGHHDTVESQYVDIFSCDMDSYHGEVVEELINDAKEDLQRKFGTNK